MMKKKVFPIISIALVFCMALSLIGGCARSSGTDSPDQTNNPGGSSSDTPVDVALIPAFTSYSELYQAISAANAASDTGVSTGDGRMLGTAPQNVDTATDAEEKSDDSMSYTNSEAGYNGSTYSETNVQVQGVDEGDIVKTDGQYIYILSGTELIICKAEGAATFEVSRLQVGSYGDDTQNTSQQPAELYISGSTAVVVGYFSSWGPIRTEYAEGSDVSSEKEPSYEEWKEFTYVNLYDISDPAKPTLLREYGQDGYYNTSRLSDGVLYTVTNYYMYGPVMDENDPSTYTPRLYNGKDQTVIPAENISVVGDIYPYSLSYTVVTAINTGSGERVSSESVLGNTSTVYMTQNYLYCAVQQDGTTVVNTYTEDVYKVEEYYYASSARIVRYALSGGQLTMSGSGLLNGYLNNQFSLDEYNGYLRAVATVNSSTWTTYTDEKHGWTNYDYTNSTNSQTNALYIFDSDLNVISSLTGLAENETIYSARYDGDIAYFVTFRQTDPLFAADLSNPYAPVLLSELKITGFSEYLHLYSAGRLFGLGMEADEDTGWTTSMKLSMFDVTDPANVTVLKSLAIGEDWSEALYNHKAILISADYDLIGFPTNQGYSIYGYSDEQGFYLRAELKLEDNVYNSRGLYIDSYLYICSASSITVVDLNTLAAVTTVNLSR